MGVTLPAFRLSRKIPCDKDKSEICFSGAVNYLGTYVINYWTVVWFSGEERLNGGVY